MQPAVIYPVLTWVSTTWQPQKKTISNWFMILLVATAESRWWFALWVEWQHQKLHTHHCPGCQKSLTKYTEVLKTHLIQHQHTAVHLAGQTVPITKPHLHLRWLSALTKLVSKCSPTKRKESERSSSAPCQIWVWRMFLKFEVWNSFFAPGMEMWPLKQDW